eukprot:TRINITY_DN1780_c1_g1_i1.p1 TRINITY_DN1780_c1_g1~~TRINITY_DN1780_c1_g1_i1.p1  ORF type:complete len:766 (+),score=136.53 TRINITY_DN1780_c1_g1_i1:189-2300(+)
MNVRDVMLCGAGSCMDLSEARSQSKLLSPMFRRSSCWSMSSSFCQRNNNSFGVSGGSPSKDTRSPTQPHISVTRSPTYTALTRSTTFLNSSSTNPLNNSACWVCPQCDVSGTNPSLEEHLTKFCPKRPVQCKSCGEHMLAKELPDHMTTCSHAKCDACSRRVDPSVGIPLHKKKFCPKRMVECSVCCLHVPADTLEEHMATCATDLVQCPQCGISLKEKYLASHSMRCMPFGQVGSLQMKVSKDLKITSVTPQGAAALGGLQKGDYITKIVTPKHGSFKMSSRNDFNRAVGPRSEVFQGTQIEIHVVRHPQDIIKWKSQVLGKKSELKSHKPVRATIQRGVISCPVTIGQETEAAKSSRLKRLSRLVKIFPTINAEVMDDFMSNPVACTRHIEAAFQSADLDGNGFLDEEEMYGVFTNLSALSGVEPPSKEAADEAFTEIDDDGNGVISFDEFFPYLRALFLDVIYGEGSRTKCKKCCLKIRDRLLPLHSGLCMGNSFPSGSLELTVDDSLVVTYSDTTGILKGDKLISVNGWEAKSVASLKRELCVSSCVYNKSSVLIEVERNDTRIQVPVTMGLPNEETQKLAIKEIRKSLKKLNQGVDPVKWMEYCLDFAKCKQITEATFAANDEEGTGFIGDSQIKDAVDDICNQIGVQPPPNFIFESMLEEVGAEIQDTFCFEELLPVVRKYVLHILDPNVWMNYVLE